MNSLLSTTDLFIFFGSIFAVMVMGLWVGRKEDSSEDYFLAGRSTRWWGVAGSIFGSNVSANALTAGTCKFSQINHLSNTGDLPINVPVALHATKIPGGTMVAQAFNNINYDMGMMMDSFDDLEGDGVYYNDGGNGYGGSQ